MGDFSKTAKILAFIAGWYVCSGVTLFGNKHMLSTLQANPDLLALSQMCITATMGASKVYGSYILSGFDPDAKPVTPYSGLSKKKFFKNMVIVGSMRIITVILGLVSLKFIAVSFTETIKSSAPFFTVLIARMMLGEKTSLMVRYPVQLNFYYSCIILKNTSFYCENCFTGYELKVNLALIPVVAGLALCSITELSFTVKGFSAAIMTNCIDCVQNVFSKKLLSTKVNLLCYLDDGTHTTLFIV